MKSLVRELWPQSISLTIRNILSPTLMTLAYTQLLEWVECVVQKETWFCPIFQAPDPLAWEAVGALKRAVTQL